MENTTPDATDVQNTVDNFEAVIASGNVKLIDQKGDVKLYRGDDGIEYIYDGSSAHNEGTEEFAQMKAENFGGQAAD
jgi:hypothetical protein